MEYCNVIVTEDGVVKENILITGEDIGAKAEAVMVEKAKTYATSGTAWDYDIENDMLDNGYIEFGKFAICLSWPEVQEG